MVGGDRQLDKDENISASGLTPFKSGPKIYVRKGTEHLL
jgi:hypothetical protein